MATTSTEFEKATDFAFKEEDIERAKALVGSYAPSGAREHLTTATHELSEFQTVDARAGLIGGAYHSLVRSRGPNTRKSVDSVHP